MRSRADVGRGSEAAREAPAAGREAAEASFASVYDELRRLARLQLRREAAGHTLDSVALVHEAYLRLHGRADLADLSRSHLLALTARAMRHVLVDHARSRLAAKRGGLTVTVTLDPSLEGAAPVEPERLLALDDALRALDQADPEACRVVELRYFAGMSHTEVAEAMGLSVATARRRWEFAKAWLARALRAATG